MTVLEGASLSCRREDRTIFEGLDFTARSGERGAVLGPSGSGKTTLLMMIAGLAAPTSGTLTVDGRPIDNAARRHFANVLQGYGLVSLLTAAENVEAALRIAGRPTEQVGEVAHDALVDVGLGEVEDHLVEELSGGQQQRVAVARALVLAPDVVLADEPTAEQDPVSRELILTRLFEVADRGGILLLATHDPAVAARCTNAVHVRPEPVG